MSSNDRMLKFIGGFIIVLVLCGLAGLIADKKGSKKEKIVEVENTSIVRTENEV